MVFQESSSFRRPSSPEVSFSTSSNSGGSSSTVTARDGNGESGGWGQISAIITMTRQQKENGNVSLEASESNNDTRKGAPSVKRPIKLLGRKAMNALEKKHPLRKSHQNFPKKGTNIFLKER
ncbi:hypothetical protein PIB30_037940 [Stylosanthes scabra]|uniref:Uncharacterized protein n=1 Tax=Stylosanthes scabra TaxID=79078 RepID=A0ABU6UDM7_9FABA|nr:hypothetical protein [Stylosanthes scabra]